MMQDVSTMRSPLTGGTMSVKHEWREMTFRKEKFSCLFTMLVCNDTGEQFTTTETDGIWLQQVHNQYRRKYSIPFVDEIRAMRERYGLSAAKMAMILGFGENQYRLYEQGEVPNVSNGRVLASAKTAKGFQSFVDAAKTQLSEKEYNHIMAHLEHIHYQEQHEQELCRLIYNDTLRGDYNGYAAMNVAKLKTVVLAFINRLGGVFNTKMNKLLFYADMLAYREIGMGMTGLSYQAIQHGPVPVRWDRVYSMLDGVNQEIVPLGSGNEGVRLVSNEQADIAQLSADEQQVLNRVIERLGNMSATEISDLSHEESAWKLAIDHHNKISYRDAFDIKGI